MSCKKSFGFGLWSNGSKEGVFLKKRLFSEKNAKKNAKKNAFWKVKKRQKKKNAKKNA